MNHTTLTDAEVADLPIAAARAELLEEILRTEPGRTRRPTPSGHPLARRRTTTVLVAAASVAAVAAVATAPVWLSERPSTSTSASTASAPAPVERALLDAPGWRLERIDEGGAAYRGDGPTLEISWRPAALHDDVLADREAAGPATTATVLGSRSVVVAYSSTDHAALRPAEGSTFLEVRGQGVDLVAFESLLASLVPAPAELPVATGDTVAERDRAIGRWQRDLAMPSGVDYLDPHLPGLTTAQSAAVTVLRGFACGWVRDYRSAVRDDDEGARDVVLAGMEGLSTSAAARAVPTTTAPAEVAELLADMRAGADPATLEARCQVIQGG